MMNATFRPGADIFSELSRLQGVLDQVFRPAERSSIRALTGAAFPVINVGTTPETIEVMALAPGLDPASLQLSVDARLEESRAPALFKKRVDVGGLPSGVAAEVRPDSVVLSTRRRHE